MSNLSQGGTESIRDLIVEIVGAPFKIFVLLARIAGVLLVTATWLFYSTVTLLAMRAEYVTGNPAEAVMGVLLFAVAFFGLGYIAASVNPLVGVEFDV